ncbi:MAG TPA: universal stress protein [Planctomycetaceae bacterium]|jgi:nucleotide-binding universal stress UspA family protein
MPWIPKACVVVPVDFSVHSLAAIATALELVAKPSDVHVIHVLMGGSDRDLLREWAPGTEAETWDSAGRQRLAEFLKSHDIAGVVQEVRLGDPGFAITDYARQQQAAMIVIPSHGFHGIRRLLLGSVADRVIRYAPCPVLVLRCHDHATHEPTDAG